MKIKEGPLRPPPAHIATVNFRNCPDVFSHKIAIVPLDKPSWHYDNKTKQTLPNEIPPEYYITLPTHYNAEQSE